MNDELPGTTLPSPAIVVAAYNRPASLLRLLNGLSKAHYPDTPIPLHISIDQSYASDVANTAHQFEWVHGPKEVVVHEEHLGLRTHLLHCGDLSNQYGSIILLEDDLYVSPEFYRYSVASLAAYHSAPRIAGISLYHYECAESTQLPFRPLEDGNDLYFMQWPSSWGLAIDRDQWSAFRGWLRVGDLRGLDDASGLEGANGIGEGKAVTTEKLDKWLPKFVQSWEPGSWKKLFVAYLRAKDLYFVYPRISLSTHFGEPGPHTILKGFQQSPLLSRKKNWKWIGLDESQAIYDSWFELLPQCLKAVQPDLASYDLTVDLYGMKEESALDSEYVLTTRWVDAQLQEQSALVPRKYALELLPVVQNVISGLEGHEIFLVRRDSLDVQPASFQHYVANLPGWSRHLVEKGISGDLLRISVVVPESGHSREAEATIASILKQERAQIEVIALVKGELEPSPDDRVRALAWPEGMDYWAALETGMRAASGDLLIWMHPGVVLETGVLEQVETILHQYREVNWLLLRPSPQVKAPGQRWTRDRFGRADIEVIQKAFGPGLCVWRRGFWQGLGEGIESGQDLVHRAFGKGLPYTADLVGPLENTPFNLDWGKDHPERGANRAKRTFPGRLLSRIARPFFLRDGSLRWIHGEIEHYPPVIRWDSDLDRWDMQRF